MSGAVRAKRATYADVVALPRSLTGELIEGVLYAHPRPATPHAGATSMLGGLLLGPWRLGRGGPGGWLILDEPELHFGEDVLVPDLGGWRRTRMPAMPTAPFIELAPDWVCEVLSPSTAATDRTDKLPLYATESVGHVWLVDPITRTLEVLRLDGARWSLVGTWRDDARVRAEPFDAIELELAALWAR